MIELILALKMKLFNYLSVLYIGQFGYYYYSIASIGPFHQSA